MNLTGNKFCSGDEETVSMTEQKELCGVLDLETETVHCVKTGKQFSSDSDSESETTHVVAKRKQLGSSSDSETEVSRVAPKRRQLDSDSDSETETLHITTKEKQLDDNSISESETILDATKEKQLDCISDLKTAAIHVATKQKQLESASDSETEAVHIGKVKQLSGDSDSETETIQSAAKQKQLDSASDSETEINRVPKRRQLDSDSDSETETILVATKKKRLHHTLKSETANLTVKRRVQILEDSEDDDSNAACKKSILENCKLSSVLKDVSNVVRSDLELEANLAICDIDSTLDEDQVETELKKDTRRINKGEKFANLIQKRQSKFHKKEKTKISKSCSEAISESSTAFEEGTELLQSPIAFDNDIFDTEDLSDNDKDRAKKIRGSLSEVDSDSENEADSKKSQKKKKSKKEKKESKKAREKELFEIRSENQRLLRESSVRLPYHKPTQRSLAEFLKERRKTTLPANLKPFRSDIKHVLALENAKICEDKGINELVTPSDFFLRSKNEPLKQLSNSDTIVELELENAAVVEEVSQADDGQKQPVVSVADTKLDPTTSTDINEDKNKSLKTLSNPCMNVELELESITSQDEVSPVNEKGTHQPVLSMANSSVSVTETSFIDNDDDKTFLKQSSDSGNNVTLELENAASQCEVRRVDDEGQQLVSNIETATYGVSITTAAKNSMDIDAPNSAAVCEANTLGSEISIFAPSEDLHDNSVKFSGSGYPEECDTLETEQLTLDSGQTSSLFNESANDSSAKIHESLDNSTSTFAEMKQMILNSVKTFTPQLSGSPDDVIDLDLDIATESEKNDFDGFIEKFVNHTKEIQKRRTGQEVKLSIVSKDETDSSKMHYSELHVNVAAVDEEPAIDKPGAKLLKLKEQLYDKILQKKEAALVKRRELEKLDNEIEPDEEEAELTDDSDSEHSIGIDTAINDEDNDNDDCNEEMDADDDSITISFQRKHKKNPFIEEEASADDDVENQQIGEDSESMNSSSSKSSTGSFVTFSGIFPKENTDVGADAIPRSVDIRKKRSRIRVLDVSDDEGEEIHIGGPSTSAEVPFSLDDGHTTLLNKAALNKGRISKPDLLPDESQLPASFAVQISPVKRQIFLSDGSPIEGSTDELLALCSGSFSDSPTMFASPTFSSRTKDDSSFREQTPETPFKTRFPESPNLSLHGDNAVLSDVIANKSDPLDVGVACLSQAAKELCFADSAPDVNDALELCSGTFSSRPFNAPEDTSKHSKGSEDRDTPSGISLPEVPSPATDVEDNADNANHSFMLQLSSDTGNEIDHEENDDEALFEKKIAGFIEDEAELSGDDIGSDIDEDDEDGEYEDDFGPAEELPSDEELRNQIGRVHLKNLLDDDKRELRLYQELYLEGGDLYEDGPGRQRKFTWRNSYANDFLNGDGENSESDQEDAPDQEKWRIERFERKKFLQEQQNSDMLLDTSSIISIKSKILSKTKEPPVVVENENSDSFLSNSNLKTSRSSFLARGDDYLNCLTKKFKKIDDESAGCRTTKHFVFRALSPKKMEAVNSQKAVASVVKQNEPRMSLKPKMPKFRKRRSVFDLLNDSTV